jgi:hypothetical protein
VRLPTRFRPAGALAVGLMLAVTATVACGSSEPTLVGTLDGVGDLPGELSEDRGLEALANLDRAELLATRSETAMADLVQGPRVMVIGDSIFASASRRYGGEICAALTPRGFDVEVNAEVGRFVDFGERVLERRLRPNAGVDWDAVVISLGSNFGGDLSAYRTRLIRILDKLEPRPVLLFTVSEFRPDRIKLNDVIVEMVRMYPNVFVVDWSAIVARDSSLLQRDRLHLTQDGRDRMAAEMARALGTYSTSQTGQCLSTEFSDDSAISGVEDATVVTPPPSGNGSRTSTSITATTVSGTTSPSSTVEEPEEDDFEEGDLDDSPEEPVNSVPDSSPTTSTTTSPTSSTTTTSGP